MRARTTQVLLLCGLVAVSAHAQESGDQHGAQEAQTKQKLEQIRVEIHKLAEEQRSTAAKRNDATNALRDADLKIAALAKTLRSIDQQLSGQQAKLDGLLVQQSALDVKLKDQRNALAALLRSAYAMGRDEELKLLLAQDHIDDISRMLAYYRYFERARVHEIDGLLQDLQALAQLQADIERETVALKASRDERAIQAQRLDGEREQRHLLLGELDAALKDQTARLAALGKDEKALVDLLAKLRDIFADIPQHLVGAEPFAAATLRCPLRFHDLRGGDRRGAERADLAGVDEIRKHPERLVDVRVRVEAVDLVEIDPVGVEPAQTVLDRLRDPAPGGSAVVRVLTERQTDLRGEHDVVAAAVGQGLADDRLRLPGRVEVGRVDEVDAGVERAVDDPDRVVVVTVAERAEHHRAEAQLTDRDAGASQWPIVHGGSSW